MGCLYLLDGWTEGYQMSDSCKVILTNSDDGFINCLEFEFDIFRTFSDDGFINRLKFEFDKVANTSKSKSCDLYQGLIKI